MAEIAENVRRLADRAQGAAGAAGLPAPGVNQWLVVVLSEFAPLVDKLAPGTDAAALRENAAAAAAKGEFGSQVAADALFADASTFASGRGSESVQAKDLVAAVDAADAARAHIGGQVAPELVDG
ncbi:MAG: hypothetical protein FDZ70_06075, partial [Actinobacteria bacterium]